MKEQWKEMETDIEKQLREKVRQAAPKPPTIIEEGEGSGNTIQR
jgi:hypothetical protein